jgi:hypothetical protein
LPQPFYILSAWKLEFDRERKSSFLKKRSKKLLPVLASVFPDRLSHMNKSFLVLFFKKELLLF